MAVKTRQFPSKKLSKNKKRAESRRKKIVAEKVSASIDKLATQCVEKVVRNNEHKGMWNEFLDDATVNGSALYKLGNVTVSEHSECSKETNNNINYIKNDLHRNMHMHNRENQTVDKKHCAPSDNCNRSISICDEQLLYSDNTHSCHNNLEAKKENKSFELLKKSEDTACAFDEIPDNNSETLTTNFPTVTNDVTNSFKKTNDSESKSKSECFSESCFQDDKEQHCNESLQYSTFYENRSNNKSNGILSCFVLFFFCLASLLFGLLASKLFIKRNTSIENDLKAYKLRVHKLKILQKKLLKKVNKNICKRRKINRKPVQNKQKNLSTKDGNKFRDFIENKIDGRRLVDINYIWRELRDKLQQHDSKKCRLGDWMFEKETNYHGGLRSQFIFKCRKCHKECRVWSEGLSKNVLGPCEASVLSTLVEGVGYTQTNGLFAGIGLPYITDKTFKRHQESLFLDIKRISIESMREANEEEAKLAKDAGDVDENGIPFITVIVDGSWLTRSYGTKYDSLSGLGAIIGQRTGKVLYVGIKNKYCTKCYRAEKAGKTPAAHICCRNFSYSVSSTLMESEALVEGFQKSFVDHKLIYKYFVGDGDSNFHKKLIDANPYAKFNIIPHKIECTNHLLRNLCKKAKTVTAITQKKSQRKKGFVTLRNMVRDSILKVRQMVVDEVDKELMDSKKTWEQKVQGLRRRILNIPSHLFGEHKRCHEFGYNCNKQCDSTKKEFNYVPFLKSFNLYDKIEDPIKYLSNHSESLLHKVTNNLVESFNSIVGKEINGKRINYACSSQYNTRVLIAVIQHNTQQAFIEIYKGMGKEVPDSLEYLIKKRMSKVARTRMDRITNGRKRKYVYQKTDKNYGPKCEKPDLTKEQLALLREEHNTKLLDNQKDRINIEIQTREQGNSDLWMNLRKHMLTASNFGRICRMRAQTSCSNLVKSLLFPTLNDTVAMQYGRETEDVARKELSERFSKEIKINGLFIDPEDPRFGASPDGLIDDDGIIELKNPFCAKDMTPSEAMATFPHINFVDKRTNRMKKTHHWFYQVQGQLHITQRKYCIFALRTCKGMAIQRIERDDEFWNIHMKPHLSTFYEHCLLPEILDSRFLRNMPIREPPHILEAKRKHNEKTVLQKTMKATTEPKDIEMILSVNDNIQKVSDDMTSANDAQTLPKKQKLIKDTVKISHKKCNSRKKKVMSASLNKEPKTLQSNSNESPSSKFTATKKGSLKKCNKTSLNNTLTNVVKYNDDIIYGGSYTDPSAFDPKAIRSLTKYFETKGIQSDVQVYTNIITDIKENLTDDVLDIFLSIVKESSNYEVQSIMYQYYPCTVQPAQTKKSIVILGGSSTNHWRLACYNEALLHVYDTLTNYTGGKLVQKEMNYVLKRFPDIQEKDVVFAKIKTKQPDNHSCGIYAAALATHLILTGDPSNISFSMDVCMMRMHFLQILKSRKLSAFPITHEKLNK